MKTLMRLVDKSDSAVHYGVVEMLRDVLAEIEAGTLDPRRALLLLDSQEGHSRRNAGCDFMQELGLLEAHKFRLLSRWIDEKDK